jgi:hypothetical protein
LIFGRVQICPKCSLVLEHAFMAVPTMKVKKSYLCQFCTEERKLNKSKYLTTQNVYGKVKGNRFQSCP